MASKSAGKKVNAIVPSKARGFDEAVEESDEAVPTEESAVQETGLAKYSAAPTLDSSDLFIPRLRLAQGLTAEVQSGLAKPGDWLLLGSDPLKTATIVPMMMVRRRELRDADGDRAVLCRSADSITGVGNPGGDCASCPMNKWVKGKGKNGKNAAPPCTFIYSYIVYVAETDELCVLEFYRSAITTGKMLNTMVLQKGLGKFAVQLKSTSMQGPKGTFYQPAVQPAPKVAEKVLAQAKAKTAEMF